MMDALFRGGWVKFLHGSRDVENHFFSNEARLWIPNFSHFAGFCSKLFWGADGDPSTSKIWEFCSIFGDFCVTARAEGSPEERVNALRTNQGWFEKFKHWFSKVEQDTRQMFLWEAVGTWPTYQNFVSYWVLFVGAGVKLVHGSRDVENHCFRNGARIWVPNFSSFAGFRSKLFWGDDRGFSIFINLGKFGNFARFLCNGQSWRKSR